MGTALFVFAILAMALPLGLGLSRIYRGSVVQLGGIPWHEGRRRTQMRSVAARLGLKSVTSLEDTDLDPSLQRAGMDLGPLTASQYPRSADLTEARNVAHGSFREHSMVCCDVEVSNRDATYPATFFLSGQPHSVPVLSVASVDMFTREWFVEESPMGAEFDRHYALRGTLDPQVFASRYRPLVEWLRRHPGWNLQFHQDPPWTAAWRLPAPPPHQIPHLADEFASVLDVLERCEEQGPADSPTVPQAPRQRRPRLRHVLLGAVSGALLGGLVGTLATAAVAMAEPRPPDHYEAFPLLARLLGASFAVMGGAVAAFSGKFDRR